MEENKMTVLGALENATNILGRINVPVSMKQQIADPICESLEYINACIDAMRRPREDVVDLGNMEEVLKEEEKSNESDN